MSLLKAGGDGCRSGEGRLGATVLAVGLVGLRQTRRRRPARVMWQSLGWIHIYVLGLVWATPLTAIITQSALLQSGRRWRLDLGLIWSPVAGALIYAGSTLSVRLCRYSGAPGSVGKFPSDAKETSKRSSRPGPAHHAVSKSSRLRSHSQDGECRKHTLCGAAPTRQPPRHIPSEG
jgi:hypothetical protein